MTALFRIKVSPDGADSFELEAGSRDILFWERVSGRTLGQLDGDGLSMGALFSLAHAVAKRQGRFPGSLAEFEETCDVSAEQVDQDPTPPDQPTGS